MLKYKGSHALGIGLIESMLVLALAAVFILLSVNYFSNAKNATQISGLISQYTEIAHAVQHCINDYQPAYQQNNKLAFTSPKDCVNLQNLIEANYLGTGAAVNAWEGNNAVHWNNDTLYILSTKVPNNVCPAKLEVKLNQIFTNKISIRSVKNVCLVSISFTNIPKAFEF